MKCELSLYLAQLLFDIVIVVGPNKGSKYCFVGQSFILKMDPANGGRVIAVDSDQSPSWLAHVSTLGN